MPIVNILLLSVLIEAVVSAIKPLWSKDGERMSVAEIVSIVLGVILAVSLRLNMMEYVADWEIISHAPPFVEYIFYILTGIALGRGPSFLWDLWQKIKKTIDPDTLAVGIADTVKEGIPVDVEITHWTLEQLKLFCELNGIKAQGCVTREDYMDAIERGRIVKEDEPPTYGGAEE